MAKAEKQKSALAATMERWRKDRPELFEATSEGVLDIGPALARARVERQARKEPPFAPREILHRARITAPLIERLVGKGELAARAQAAADEIRYIHEALTSGGNVKAVDWDSAGSGPRGTPICPAGGTSDHAQLLRRMCLDPWEREMTENPPRDGRDRPLHAALLVVKMAVLKGPSLRELERLGGLRNGQAVRVIREGLARYSTFEELMATRGKRGKAGV